MKRKLDENTSIEDLLVGWTKCQYFLPHKRRLCRMEVSPGTVFCGNHQPLSSLTATPATTSEEQKRGDAEDNSRSSRRALKKAARGDRIPCPLDPSHNIYRSNLESHLRVCNEHKKTTMYSSWPYFCQNCNGGEVKNDFAPGDQQQDINVDVIVSKIQRIYDSIESNLPRSVEDDDQLLDSCSEVTSIDERIRSEIGKDQTSFEQLRHIEQDIKIVHHMIAANLLQVQHDGSSAARDVFLEFGAGKGLLGYAVYFANSSSSIGLVERGSNRKKIDKFLLEKQASFERYRMDIRHCLLPNLPLVIQATENGAHRTKVAVIAKHLCGVASDLAIRSLCHLNDASYRRGLALATCCHHACQFDDYVGRDWLVSFGVTREEFNIFKYWSSWASLDRTAEHRKPGVSTETAVAAAVEGNDDKNAADEEEEHKAPNLTTGLIPRPTNLDHKQLAIIGRQIKRIIDFGRLKFLKETLAISSAKMIKYCDEKLSPECILLLANSE